MNKVKLDAGMTYIELIIVLSIVATMSGIISFNYKTFDDRINLSNATNELALRIIEAQKSALSGIFPKKIDASGNLLKPQDNWKPSYGIYFDSSPIRKIFYFSDINNNNEFDGTDCTASECLEDISSGVKNILGKNKFDKIFLCSDSDCKSTTEEIEGQVLLVIFTRPNFKAEFKTELPPVLDNVCCLKIDIKSPGNTTSSVIVSKSGRIQTK